MISPPTDKRTASMVGLALRSGRNRPPLMGRVQRGADPDLSGSSLLVRATIRHTYKPLYRDRIEDGRLGESALPWRFPRRGMTLVEVMLGLTLIVLISGGVIAVVQSALTSTQIARKEFHQDEEIAMLFAYFRNLFLNLSPAVELRTAEEPPGNTYQQLQFQYAPELFSWGKGREGPPDTQVFLSTRQLRDGVYCLVLEKQLQHPQQNFIRKELVLFDGLTFLEWSFFEPHDQKWLSSWSDLKQRPTAVRLRIQRENDPQPLQAIFSLSPAIPQKLSL